MSSTKRKFKYKLSGFEQMWEELQRLEDREIIMVETLKDMVDVFNNKSDADVNELLQACLQDLRGVPGKSAGFKMIENMGLEFYEKAKQEFSE